MVEKEFCNFGSSRIYYIWIIALWDRCAILNRCAFGLLHFWTVEVLEYCRFEMLVIWAGIWAAFGGRLWGLILGADIRANWEQTLGA